MSNIDLDVVLEEHYQAIKEGLLWEEYAIRSIKKYKEDGNTHCPLFIELSDRCSNYFERALQKKMWLITLGYNAEVYFKTFIFDHLQNNVRTWALIKF